MRSLLSTLRREPVLTISALLAVCSMLVVPPSAEYFDYIDLRVLAQLFCLMAVVAGLMKEGLFDWISRRLLVKTQDSRRISLLLINLCFFSSMFVTNDVALLTFVPLTIGILGALDQNSLIFTIVMETMAANLGSMATPVGNPQNLFLYGHYQLGLGQFLMILGPMTILSYAMLMMVSAFRKGTPLSLDFPKPAAALNKKRLLILAGLFLVSIGSVLHVIHYGAALAVVVMAFLLLDRAVLKEVDYGLLATFVCFFIFVGNMGCLPQIQFLVSGLLTGRDLVVSALICQLISNVPAAIMLSGFTEEAEALLLGVNLGGLGTLWASLASLISFKFYTRAPGAKSGRYLLSFTLWNVAFLGVLLTAAAVV